uniref:transcription elongation protein SprT n=2 Tax=Roseivirga sp. TaxID=1964215 RepID=UPI004048B1D1
MEDGLRAILSIKMPERGVDYCLALAKQYPFHFTVTRKRLSKLGDYRYSPRDQSHTVTVNGDLNPYQFLITYVHEVAHRVVHKPRSRQLPHGDEWKEKFRELMFPLLNPDVFPDDVLRVLAKHMKNPKASTSADHKLVKVLAQYDESAAPVLTLDQVPLEAEFLLRKRKFKKLEIKRTRALCLDIKNGKRYLIPQIAQVEFNQTEKKPLPLTIQKVEIVKKKKLKKVNPAAHNQMNLFE